MFSCIKTCTLEGLQGHIINVEIDISRGKPKFSKVELPDSGRTNYIGTNIDIWTGDATN